MCLESSDFLRFSCLTNNVHCLAHSDVQRHWLQFVVQLILNKFLPQTNSLDTWPKKGSKWSNGASTGKLTLCQTMKLKIPKHLTLQPLKEGISRCSKAEVKACPCPCTTNLEPFSHRIKCQNLYCSNWQVFWKFMPILSCLYQRPPIPDKRLLSKQYQRLYHKLTWIKCPWSWSWRWKCST